jgi:hypothetical protein
VSSPTSSTVYSTGAAQSRSSSAKRGRYQVGVPLGRQILIWRGHAAQVWP